MKRMGVCGVGPRQVGVIDVNVTAAMMVAAAAAAVVGSMASRQTAVGN